MSIRLTALALLTGVAVLAQPVRADGLAAQGLADPTVAATAQDWTGFYAGLSYGRTKATTTRQTFGQRCYKLFDGARYIYPGEDAPRLLDCSDEAFTYWGNPAEVVEVPTGTITETSRQDVAGAFAGYRHDFGRLVGGIEVGTTGKRATAEAQLGLDLGPVLAYGLAGVTDGGTLYGAGADLRIGQRLMVGAKVTEGPEGQTATLRLGIRF